ncbi:phycobiliprotein lyase [Aphanothece hegewaldii CCALA 016]|uniref:Chromophore lyase CpcS/CpeS n=1 Tax=Aphanothece hegewaldii CCALA 016 TaxID=2107694 RepID=A0A2T1LWQ1_9CHRO|nr:phycobiliprotein lyase [Aphanothece hegewaldii]PSF36586.1 phycobiliprotein lyase [Aphanothece hegewaldii CCALA 016]
MTSISIAQLSTEALALDFLHSSEGNWKSQRRYYTLKQETEPQEVVSYITIRNLVQGCPELIKLANLHDLEDENAILGGSIVTWESNYIKPSRQPLKGSTIFGILGDILYRDKGFATDKPVTAIYSMTNPNTLCLRTEYGGSVFEEEIKMINQQYRTRQTIISRAGEEIMVTQYLENRI